MGEAEDARIERVPGREPAEESPLQQVLLSPAPGVSDPDGITGAGLVVEESDEGVERGLEGRDFRPFDPLAVPPTIVELMAQEPVDDSVDIGAQ